MYSLGRQWQTQPQEYPSIDWENPLNDGLISAGTVIGGAPYDIVNRVSLVRSGTADLSSGVYGRFASTPNSSSALWSATFTPIQMPTNVGAIYVRAYSDAGTSTDRKRAIALRSTGAGTILNIDFGPGDETAKFAGGCQVTGGLFPIVKTSTETPANGSVYHVLFGRSGTAMTLYVSDEYGNIFIGQNVLSARSENFAGSINQIILGNNTSALPLQGGVLSWMAWRDRSPGLVDFMRLIQEPWGWLESQHVWIPSSSPIATFKPYWARSANVLIGAGVV